MMCLHESNIFSAVESFILDDNDINLIADQKHVTKRMEKITFFATYTIDERFFLHQFVLRMM